MKKTLITVIFFAVGLSLQAQNLYVQPITGEQIPFVLEETRITFADRVMTVGTTPFQLGEVRNLSFVATGGNDTRIVTVLGENDIRVFPNPVRDELTLEVREDLQNLTFRMFDLSGRQMSTGRVLSPQTVIDMSLYASGTYILIIEQGGQRVQSFQIVKQ